MSKGTIGLLAVGALMMAGSGVLAREAGVARTVRSTSIAHARPDGKVLVLATGTEEGECSVFGGRMACRDGGSYAIADAQDGCRKVSGGARCSISEPDRPPREEDAFDTGLVETQESSVDIECEGGSKLGGIYTITDGDGQGSCGADRSVGGRVIGGTCTKNGNECTSFDCEHGCSSGNNNCQCKVKSAPKKKPVVDTQ